MVVGEPNINNIMGGIENTGTVRLHNHRKKLKQRFDIIKKLGQGTYGKVQLGINKETGQEVAIKTIKKSKIETEADLVRIRREIQIMSSVQHPNIIHIYEVFENREKMVLVMEYAAGGELYDYLSERKVLAEEEARRIFRQIATACYYCHKHKICHRDLKLENILLDEHGNAKIADFGLSNVFDDQRLLSTFCGSPLYASPEIVKGTPYHGPEVDCWSLGVLLYTLVYGAMPFDGSNFKRLVRQISQGDYYEPKKPSRASPLIRDMLTVNPRNRASIEKICLHWWVNESYDECCLDISEELANQTPVRLDLLLSLAPPPPQLESEKLVVTGETPNEPNCNTEAAIPTRSHSVGSLMELTNPAQRRIKDLMLDDAKSSPKRKLETTISTDQVAKDEIKRKEKIVKEHTIADITLHSGTEATANEDASMTETTELNKNQIQVLSPEMDISEEYVDPSTQGAACTEIIEDAKKNEINRNDQTKSKQVLEEVVEVHQEAADKENIKEVDTEVKEQKTEEKQSKIPAKRKLVKKKVLTDKNENVTSKPEHESAPVETAKVIEEEKNEIEDAQTVNNKPVERRRSRIFETAEKFQNMISANEAKSGAIEKPKKIVIPGVSVGGYKKEFERKASLTSTNKIGLVKKPSLDQEEAKVEPPKDEKVNEPQTETVSSTEGESQAEKERRMQVKNAVDIISNALEKDGTRKSKSRPCMIRKPPVPFGVGGRSASGSIATIPLPLSPPPQEAFIPGTHGSIPAQVVEETKTETPEEEITSSAEITLKSATLPRRRTTKAEIQLDYPAPKPATMGFKTEMAHHVEGHPKLSTQRSEVTVPVSPPPVNNFRSASVEPESKIRPRERIIPISFERDVPEEKRESVPSPPIKPPVTRIFQTQRSTTSQRSNSLSRQSTQESDSESNVVSGEPIRKSPREYIIPIAVEGGGYVTPRAGSLEPSDTASTTSTMTNKSKFGRRRLKYVVFFSIAFVVIFCFSEREGSEDESPFAALHRHSSFGRDSDTEDSRRDIFRMHSLRSSRPRKTTMEHNDSFSSGEDDDDDGFEILTAENLFSTLLSRVRDLTQRLNVDGRPGFPASRLLSSHFDRGGNFWNMHNRMDPLSRYSSMGRSSREQSVDSSSRNANTPWRRSVSRDLASDIDSVFNNSATSPTHTATLPRGDANSNRENLNLTDLDLKKLKLSDEDALALSYLTPGLSRRIQKQLLAQLAPSEAKKLSRTLSMRNSTDNKSTTSWDKTKSDSRLPDTTPSLSRRLSVESSPLRYRNKTPEDKNEDLKTKSSLPVKSSNRDVDVCRRLRSPSESKHTHNDSDDYLNKSSDSSRLCKYLSPTKYYENMSRAYTPVTETKPDLYPTRKPSRFLRPDFYENKDANYFLKEKKEREIETQKVLKEIRDRRRSRVRELSVSKDSNKIETNGCLSEEKGESDKSTSESTDNILKTVSDNIKNLESNVKNMHDYVNVSVENKIPDYVNVTEPPVVKKANVSKIARPKSYPTETQEHKKLTNKTPEVTNKSSKTKKPEKVKEGEKCKNKFLQSIEKKFERLRSFSNSPTTSISSEEARAKSSVEDTIKRLREQSLPRTVDNCITESGLIKRAVSVEDLSTSDPKQLQASRKSVTKILNLFKKYEEKSNKTKEKSTKSKKSKDEVKKPKEEAKKVKVKNNQSDSVEKNHKQIGAAGPVPSIPVEQGSGKKPERPNSLLLENVKFNAQGESSIKDCTKLRTSKLPITSFRRSLNLENAPIDCNNKYSKSDSVCEAVPNHNNLSLQLQLPANLESGASSPHDKSTNRNSFATTDDSSLLLSPYEDNLSCDSWSICSDYHTQELTSPVSPCGTFYSADENESVSDRIRRKSFYTRFNEKKRPRKTSLNSYRDLDLYKDTNSRKSNYRSDYNYLDRKSAEPETSKDKYYEPLRYKRYGQNNTENDFNEFFPNKYQTYNPRLYRRATSVYSSDAEESNILDESSATGKHKMYSSYYSRPSRFSNRSVSPLSGHDTVESSVTQNTVHSPTSQNHV
ncbi:hypothetical protein FQR65_LT11669 [Abscondita terminalis]|nr:hypothetical protein FQR65_LT11669 [Abscondita terminalis]